MTPTPVSKPTIQAALFDAGIDAPVDLPDASYALPDETWIAHEFAAGFIPFRDEYIDAYAAEEVDCDDFAEAAKFFAHSCHRKTAGRPKATGLAFGEFWFTRRDGEHHAINVAVCRDQEGKLHLVFFEPQTAQIIQLTQEEIASCAKASF